MSGGQSEQGLPEARNDMSPWVSVTSAWSLGRSLWEMSWEPVPSPRGLSCAIFMNVNLILKIWWVIGAKPSAPFAMEEQRFIEEGFLVIAVAWSFVLNTHVEPFVYVRGMRWTQGHNSGWSPEQQRIPATREEIDQGRRSRPSTDYCNHRPQPDSAMQTTPPPHPNARKHIWHGFHTVFVFIQ